MPWADTATHMNAAAMFLHDPVTDPQAETRAVLSLGCEERLEYAWSILWQNTGAVVGECHAHTYDGSAFPFVS